MNKAASALYALANENIAVTPEYQEQIRAFAKAKLAVLEELELISGKSATVLLDTYTSLDGRRETLHEEMIFEAALKLGMELGRLTLTT
ncbi:MAG: hypothetical protein HFF29_06485 [Oscillospiraceae bacterium]|nr:hypothetical protein [Oscillospiraceae bacterium]